MVARSSPAGSPAARSVEAWSEGAVAEVIGEVSGPLVTVEVGPVRGGPLVVVVAVVPAGSNSGSGGHVELRIFRHPGGIHLGTAQPISSVSSGSAPAGARSRVANRPPRLLARGGKVGIGHLSMFHDMSDLHRFIGERVAPEVTSW